MARPVLYFDDRSPPVRSCLMLIKMLDLDVELKAIDLFKNEQLAKNFLAINPAHTVPTLVDRDLILRDSHVILLHLCELAKANPLSKSLCPEDYRIRMNIMNFLFFECSILFRRDSELMSEIVRKGFKGVDLLYHRKKISEAYTMMENFFNGNNYLIGDQLTIADISVVTTLSTLNMMFPVDEGDWPKLNLWYERMRVLSANEINRTGLKRLLSILEAYGEFNFPNQNV